MTDEERAVLVDMLSGGALVQYGDRSTMGNLSRETVGIMDDEGDREITQTSVIVITGDLGTLLPDTAITVDGQSYQIRTARQHGDGQLTRIRLVDA